MHALLSDGYRLLASVEQDATGRLATIRLGFPVGGGDDVVVDILFASSGIEPEIADAAEVMDIVPGLRLPVAVTGHLIALKLLARDDAVRPQDLADLRAGGAGDPLVADALAVIRGWTGKRTAAKDAEETWRYDSAAVTIFDALLRHCSGGCWPTTSAPSTTMARSGSSSSVVDVVR